MQLELVSVVTSDGVRLDGALARPQPGVVSSLGIDAVVLHHGYSANFYMPGFLATMQERLASLGVLALRVNNRGHDLVFNSAAGRLGSSYELLADCRLDWKAWFDFAESLGCRSVVPWGHSLGAVKTAYYVATERDARVPGAILSSPPRFSYSQSVTMERGGAWREVAAEARRLVEAGRGAELMQVTEPLNSLMSAATFADKYGPEEKYNVLTLLELAKVPVLVTLGALEGTGPESRDWTAFGGVAEQLSQIAASQDGVEFEHIEGANHGYSGKNEELWTVALGWLQRLRIEVAAGERRA